jgi:opacity protein-like surface antigen
MKKNESLLGCILATLLFSMSTAQASLIKTTDGSPSLIVSVMGGAAFTQLETSTTFVDSAQNEYLFNNNSKQKTSATFGILIGTEIPFKLGQQSLAWQPGLSYEYMTSSKLNGLLTYSGSNITSRYNYNYNIQSSRTLFSNRILFMKNSKLNPYLGLGLGMSMNRASGYSATPIASADDLPNFGKKMNYSFTYKLSTGLEFPLSKNFAMGLGYAFSDLGATKFDSEQFAGSTINGPQQKHLYIQEVSAYLSWLI